MPQQAKNDAAVEAEIARLADLDLGELRARWKTLFGHPAPKSLRRKFLAHAVAYQMQVEAYGGLSEATKRRLCEIAARSAGVMPMQRALEIKRGPAPR